MAASLCFRIGVTLGILCGSAQAMDVDRTGTLSAPSPQGIAYSPRRPAAGATVQATFPEIMAVAPYLLQRNQRLSALDRPCNPRVCIGC